MFSAHCSTRNTFRSSNSCFFASSSGGQFLVSAASAAALAASRSFALTFSRERSHKKRHSSAALRRNRAPAGAQNKKVRNSSCLSCVYCTGDGYARTVPSCYYSGISFKKMGMPQALQVSG